MNTNYGFSILFSNTSTKIHYEISLNEISRSKEKTTYSINRSQFLINNAVPDYILYEMADKMVKSIYPIVFTVNNKNEIISTDNLIEIKKTMYK